MIVVAESSKVVEILGYKEGTSLGLSVWSAEGITEGIMIGPIEVSLECSSLGIFEWYYEGVK